MLGIHDIAKLFQIIDGEPDIGKVGAQTIALAMTAMINAVTRESGSGQRRRNMAIAPAVLPQPMYDQDYAANVALWQPFTIEDPVIVFRHYEMLAFDHCLSPHSHDCPRRTRLNPLYK